MTKTFNPINPKVFTGDTVLINTLRFALSEMEEQNDYKPLKENFDGNLRKLCTEFVREMTFLPRDKDTLERCIWRFKESLKEYNKSFKKYFINVSDKYKNANIYVMSFKGKDIYKITGIENDWQWKKKKVNDGSPDIMNRMNYTYSKISKIFPIEYAMLYVKYGKVYYSQCLCAFLKLMIELFNPLTVEWNKTLSVFDNLLNQTTWKEIQQAIDEFNLTQKTVYKKKKEKSMPTKEQCEKSLNINTNKSRKQIYNDLAKDFDTGFETIRKLFKKYGLTNQKYTNKNKLK